MVPITSWDDYFIPGTEVLANKLGLTEHATLQVHEAAITAARITELVSARVHPITLDYSGFQQIHRVIFDDIYAWAGEPRTTPAGRMTKRYRDVVNYPLDDRAAPEIAYGYYPGPAVAEAARHRFSLLAAEDALRGLERDEFVVRLAEHWAEINTVHVFREGNTRTQAVFFALLADAAGHPLQTLELLRSGPLREDFIAARFYAQMTVNYGPLARVLNRIVR